MLPLFNASALVSSSSAITDQRHQTFNGAKGLSVLGKTLTLDESKLVVCLNDKSCTSYDASNFKDG